MGRTQRMTDASTSAARHAVRRGAHFWAKLNEDWTFNFSGMLAYNYLTALAPMLLALLAIGALVLGTLSPAAYAAFVQSLASNFPGDVGQSLVNAALSALRQEAGALLIIALCVAIYSGSRLFVALDNVFAVIFRVKPRPLIRQNVMAILMTLLFIVLAPLAFFTVSLSATALGLILPAGLLPNRFLLTIESVLGGILIAFILFAAMYSVVPNRLVKWRAVWPGALIAAALLNLCEALFPLYQGAFLQNAGYGSVVGLAVIVLAFLYIVGFITLLGAEANAWAAGLRPLGATLPELFRQKGQAPDASARRTPRLATTADRSPRADETTRPPDASPSAT